MLHKTLLYDMKIRENEQIYLSLIYAIIRSSGEWARRNIDGLMNCYIKLLNCWFPVGFYWTNKSNRFFCATVVYTMGFWLDILCGHLKSILCWNVMFSVSISIQINYLTLILFVLNKFKKSHYNVLLLYYFSNKM